MCQNVANCPCRQALSRPAFAADFFSEMAMRLAPHGGLVSEAALQARLHRQGHSFEQVSAWLDEGRLRSVGWGSQRWLPAFQFEEDGRTPRDDVAAVADELAGAMDDLEILAWFSCPNEALGREPPVLHLRAGGLENVLETARLDRFLASG